MNLPSSLKDRLTEAAQRSGRSLSSEIIIRLEASLSLADDNNMDFTPEAFEQFIINIVINATSELEDKVHDLQREVQFLQGRL